MLFAVGKLARGREGFGLPMACQQLHRASSNSCSSAKHQRVPSRRLPCQGRNAWQQLEKQTTQPLFQPTTAVPTTQLLYL
jgi:hypothetical protein